MLENQHFKVLEKDRRAKQTLKQSQMKVFELWKMTRRDTNNLFIELMKNSLNCIEELDNTEEWKKVKNQFNEIMVNSDSEGIEKLRMISDEVSNELEMINKEMNRIKNEFMEMDMNRAINEIENAYASDYKVYSFSDGQRKEIANELVIEYPESLLNVNMIDNDSRNIKNEVEMDHRMKYVDFIIQYMVNEFDISELNGIEFHEFCSELIEMNIPFKMDIMNRLLDGNEYGNRWKSRFLIVNGNEYQMIFDYMKLSDRKYNNERGRFEINRTSIVPLTKEILNDFESFFGTPSTYEKQKGFFYKNIIALFNHIGMNTYHEHEKKYLYNYTSSLCFGSFLLENTDYDDKMREWLGSDYDMKLLYRASEHGYTASSFITIVMRKDPL